MLYCRYGDSKGYKRIGVLASYLAHKVLFEGFVIEPGASFEVPLLGRSIDIGADNIIITGPPVVFNIDNIGDFDF